MQDTPFVHPIDNGHDTPSNVCQRVFGAERKTWGLGFFDDPARFQLSQLHVEHAWSGIADLTVHFARPTKATMNGVKQAWFPLCSEHFHGNGDAAFEVFWCFSLVHMADE
jgi:hypothetical protein